ncbi:MAG: glycosyltransferase family 4 protein [Hyphomonadaceae bacterium]
MSPRILVWFWSGGGGGSQFAARLTHRLSLRFGADRVALSMRADDPTLDAARRHGLSVRPADIVSDRRRPLATAASLMRGARVLAEHARDADVVIAAMNFATAAPLALTLRKPLVYCAHDPAPHPGDYAVSMQKTTQAALLKRADAVVALSRFVADELGRALSPAKLHTAPLSSVFAPREAPRRRHLGPTRMLFLGRMIDYKGVDILADALTRIEGRNDWRLTVAGHGPALTPALVSRLSATPGVDVLAGWLSDAEIAALLEEHDVLVAPYRSASQSGVVAEALAAGLPCVVTPVGALVEQIGEGAGGWIARGTAPDAFAAALSAALADPAAISGKAEGALALARAAWEAPYWDWLDRTWGPPN